MSDYLERLIDRKKYILHQHDDILSKLYAMSGTVLHPDVLDLLGSVCGREEFWIDLCSPRLSPSSSTKGLSERRKSASRRYPSSQSFSATSLISAPGSPLRIVRVAKAASLLSRIFGLTEQKRSLWRWPVTSTTSVSS